MQDEQFLREVYEGSYRRLVGGIYGMCGDLATAEEIVQEAFVRAIAARRDFRSVDNPEAWLRRVAINVYNSWWRRTRRGFELAAASASSDPPASPSADVVADHVALVGAMMRLPEAQREALALFYLLDLTVAEVAATLGVPDGTVKARLARGRQALGEMLSTAGEVRDG